MKHNIIQKKIQEDFALIQENLQAAESMHPVIGIKAIEQRSAIEDALYNLLEKYGSFVYKQGIYAQIAPALAQFQVRLSCLPYAPRIEPVTRAQNLLQMAPYILVVDQPLEPENFHIEHILVANCQNTVLFDQVVTPSRSPQAVASSPEDLLAQSSSEESIPIAQMFSGLRNVLCGHYVLTFDLPRTQIQLGMMARHFHQKAPILIGESILSLSLKYLGVGQKTFFEGSRNNSEQIAEVLFQRLWTSSSGQQMGTMHERAANMMQVVQEMAEGQFALNGA
jgi:hypothetical protein